MSSPARRAVSGAAGGAIALIVFLAISVSGAGAATLQGANTGTDSGNCQTTSCATIGYAVGQSVNDDTIQVEAGNYVVTSVITVNKAVTISGAQAGVDARTRNVASD